jgi:hypothetical protein
VRLAGSADEVMNHPEIASLYLGGTRATTAEAAQAAHADEGPDEAAPCEGPDEAAPNDGPDEAVPDAAPDAAPGPTAVSPQA